MEFILNRPLSIINKHLKIFFFLWFLFSSWLLPPLPVTGHGGPGSLADGWLSLCRPSCSGLSGSIWSSLALALRSPELRGVCVCVCVGGLRVPFQLSHSHLLQQVSCIHPAELWSARAESWECHLTGPHISASTLYLQSHWKVTGGRSALHCGLSLLNDNTRISSLVRDKYVSVPDNLTIGIFTEDLNCCIMAVINLIFPHPMRHPFLASIIVLSVPVLCPYDSERSCITLYPLESTLVFAPSRSVSIR